MVINRWTLNLTALLTALISGTGSELSIIEISPEEPLTSSMESAAFQSNKQSNAFANVGLTMEHTRLRVSRHLMRKLSEDGRVSAFHTAGESAYG